ncbi:MAG: acyloxyacyl hydrolase [Desulfovermiculus sp.]
MRKVVGLVAVMCFILSICPALAEQSAVRISGGGGWEADGMVRMSYVRDIGVRFGSSSLGHFSPEVEGGGGLWFSSDKTGIHADITPMLRYTVHGDWGITPFLEGGLGVTYISYEEFADQELGSHFQFRDVFGLGMEFGSARQYSLHARYVHYSNADLADENDGMDFWLLSVGVGF